MVHRDLRNAAPSARSTTSAKAVLLNLAVQLRLGSTCSSGSERPGSRPGSVRAHSWL
jgi:hypothetical protein